MVEEAGEEGADEFVGVLGWERPLYQVAWHQRSVLKILTSEKHVFLTKRELVL